MTRALMSTHTYTTSQVMKDYDKTGEALKQQRFAMLEHIAEELSGDVIFPTFFDAVLNVRNALRDSEISKAGLIALIHTEPLICARIVHEANTKTGSRRTHLKEVDRDGKTVPKMVGSVSAAIDILGIGATRNLCLNNATSQLVRCKELVVFQEVSRVLWEHSLYSAAAAEVICITLTRLDPDQAFFAGLIHDLGAFYMLYRSAQYAELRVRPDTVKHIVAQWHESIGETLLASLHLPEALVAAVSHHDQPRPPLTHNPRNLNEIVYAANALAQIGSEWLDEQAIERVLGEQYHALVPEIRARYESLKGA